MKLCAHKDCTRQEYTTRNINMSPLAMYPDCGGAFWMDIPLCNVHAKMIDEIRYRKATERFKAQLDAINSIKK